MGRRLCTRVLHVCTAYFYIFFMCTLGTSFLSPVSNLTDAPEPPYPLPPLENRFTMLCPK
jgi:hypothetical protein